ncbi:MAG: hypothetical protein EOO09_04360 [Chitinophagaceae bacterium]|nr:MAG: hypothetical protein EOO09_04360 [Chitinophagaceae bacterium]
MDEIKKYLQAKREELDTAVPPPAAWDNIRKALHPEAGVNTHDQQQAVVRRIGSYKIWIAAAAVLLMGATAFYINSRDQGGPAYATTTGTNPLHLVKDLSASLTRPQVAVSPAPLLKNNPSLPVVQKKSRPVVKQSMAKTREPETSFSIEASYAAFVEEQLRELRGQPVYIDDPEYFDFFRTQFAALEKEEREVKNTIRKDGLDDVTLDLLIRVYQLKAGILRDLRSEINRVNTRIRTQPGGATREASFINL